MDAVRADAKLVAFLTDARDSAASSSADADVSLADAHRATAASGALKFPELLALGCCLTAGGGCAADVLARTTHDDLDAARSAADASAAAAEIFVLAASHPDASRLPASRLLAANAFACQPPRAASRCGRELVQLYRRAGTEGFDIGTVRAGEILLARYAGDRVDPSGGGGGGVRCARRLRRRRRQGGDPPHESDEESGGSDGEGGRGGGGRVEKSKTWTSSAGPVVRARPAASRRRGGIRPGVRPGGARPKPKRSRVISLHVRHASSATRRSPLLTIVYVASVPSSRALVSPRARPAFPLRPRAGRAPRRSSPEPFATFSSPRRSPRAPIPRGR